jgi:hypothetical protein
MPYKSEKQRIYLRANKPEVAARYEAHDATPDDGSKFETESHVYNNRQRNNLRRGRPKAPNKATAY